MTPGPLRFFWAWALCLPAAWAQTNGGPRLPISALDDRPFRHTNENLIFEVRYFTILGGYAQMKVEQGGDGMTFRMRAWTTPLVATLYRLDLNLTSRVETNELTTLFYEEKKWERTWYRFHQMLFSPDRRLYRYGWFHNGRTNYDPIPVSAVAYDAVSSFYVARCLDLTPGRTYLTQAHWHRGLEPIEIIVREKQTLRTKWGKIPCVVIVPRMRFHGIFLNEGDIVIWLSDDATHTPMQMESKLSFGAFRATLVDGYTGNR